MWPFKKNTKSSLDNVEVANNKSDNKTTTNVPKSKKITKKPAKSKITTTSNKQPKKATNNKIYVGDKKKIITLRLSDELLSKIKHHAIKNKKMTLSQFTRHLYNEELMKLGTLISKPELNLETEQ